MKKNEKGITLLCLIIVGIIIVAVVMICKMMAQKNNTENNAISREESEKINDWNGVYTKGNTTITLTRTGARKLEISLSKYSNGMTVDTKEIDVSSSSKLIYDKDVEIEKTKTGFQLNASDNSALNDFNGNYERQVFLKSGWDGVYTNSKYTITLAEIEDKKLRITIRSKLEEWDAQASEYNEETIKYQGSLYGKNQQIQITKSGDDIEIEASSDNKDSVLNRVKGRFEK